MCYHVGASGLQEWYLPMSHQQLSAISPAQPAWKRWFNIVFCGLILSGAAVVNVTTQMHLSGRIPDWAGLTWIIPIASWLYSIQCTVNWATTSPASPDRKAAFHSVLISVGIAEAMNLGEHVWAYVLEHGKLDLGVTPSLLVGSLPAIFDFLSIESAARVLSGHHVPKEAELSETELSEDAEPSAAPQPEISESEPRNLPNPQPLPEPEPIVPNPAPEDPAPELPKEEKLPKLSERRTARRNLIEELGLVIAGLMVDDSVTEDQVKEILSARELKKRYPEITYTDRNWLNVRNDAMAIALDLVTKAA